MDGSGEGTIPLLRQTRAGVTDNLHTGAVVVVDDTGRVLTSHGSPDTSAYIRSSAKPIQCLPVIACGAADAFGLDDADVAIVCGSHREGPDQVAQVRSLLAKADIPESALQAGSGISDNCSGKHAGMLIACKHQGYSLDDYVDLSHPHQQAVLATIKDVCCLSDEQIHLGIDGCSAPIHYFAIRHMALGYARLSRPEQHFGKPTAAAARRIMTAMAHNAGGLTGEPEYLDVLGGVRLITKGGGYGVYCAGVIDRGIGFAMKVADGSGVPLIPVFAEVMRRLDVLSDTEAATVLERFAKPVQNRRGQAVGTLDVLI